jgi:diaminopimelate decarboxylase
MTGVLKSDVLGGRDHLAFQSDGLAVEGKSCAELAERYGTPLYVLSERSIRHNYRSFRDALVKYYPNVLVCPAYKANSHLAVCRLYEIEGAGAEVVSSGELRTALDIGVAPERIVFNGPVKTKADLELAVSSGVGLVNADSVSELDRMQDAARVVGKRCNVGIRVNIGIAPKTHPYLATAEKESKFGVGIEDAVAAYKEAVKRSELNVIGIHSHIGSSLYEPDVIREMSKRVLKLSMTINEETGLSMLKIDLGGGLAFPYEVTSPRMSCNEYAAAILGNNGTTLEKLKNPRLIFEPGRSIVADSGILLTRVHVLKRQGDVNWAMVDAGMNTFIRPALYGAKHQIILANQRQAEETRYSIGGPCCESGDVLGKNVALPTLYKEDLLAILDVGAYGFTMSNNYNGQARPAVVLVSEDEAQLIRRRETYEEMVVDEIIPPKLTK